MMIVRLFSDTSKKCDCEFSADMVNFNRSSKTLQYHIPGSDCTDTVYFTDYHIVVNAPVLMYDVILEAKQ